MRAGEVRAEPSERVLRVEHPHRLGLALERRGLQLLVVEHRCGGLVGGETHGHAHVGCHRLDPRGGVDRVPGEQAFSRARGDPDANEGLPGVDPDPQTKRCSADRFEILSVLADPKSCANRALGVVLVGRRYPEDPDDRIPDELLHHASV